LHQSQTDTAPSPAKTIAGVIEYFGVHTEIVVDGASVTTVKKYVLTVTLALRYSIGLFLGFVPQPKLPLLTGKIRLMD
jgi:hypothetical protein